jgi:hypothetical protein
MMSTSAESSITDLPTPIRAADLDPSRIERRHVGRNRTKADVLIYRTSDGRVAVKDYAPRPWIIRHTLGRWLVRRECRAYAAAAGVPGLPRFLGRPRPLALDRFDRLERIVDEMHRRGVALADLSHRDVLLAEDGSVYVIDLAAAWVLGDRPGRLRRRIFAHFREADRFSVGRLRARFTGGDREAAVRQADPRARAWHRRARRVKWLWDRLRGAPRIPPVDDHWRF